MPQLTKLIPVDGHGIEKSFVCVFCVCVRGGGGGGGGGGLVGPKAKHSQ